MRWPIITRWLERRAHRRYVEKGRRDDLERTQRRAALVAVQEDADWRVRADHAAALMRWQACPPEDGEVVRLLACVEVLKRVEDALHGHGLIFGGELFCVRLDIREAMRALDETRRLAAHHTPRRGIQSEV